ncbi:MAG: hypothetical protein KatS3mg113_0901 [Planctomycetaceae bacterium]|nr:MAG: hypothetical protein KatS3mg113_0901 [Planctomycetaceae bacterium]
MRSLKPVVVCALISGFVWIVAGDSCLAQQAAAGGKSSQPHKIALIDMAHVFKNYEKFNLLREDLRKKVLAGEEQARQKAEELKQLQQEMKTFQEGSPEFVAREKRLTTMAAEFETFRKSMQREFIREESQIYHTIYMDVVDMVKRLAEHPSYNYTLVLRFTREELDPDNAQKLIEGMNRQVVYYKEEDDITDLIVEALNGRFRRQSGATTSNTTQQTGGTTSAAPSSRSTGNSAAAPRGTTNR